MKFHEAPLNERDRLKALHDLAVLDTMPEQCYDNLVKLAARVCETPIAAISLVADNRTWSKSVLGLTDEQRNCPREFSFCALSIESEEPIFQIVDATVHPHFAGSPLVVDHPKIAFYAAANLKTSSGHTVGTLCVLDHVPRKLTEFQLETLRSLGDQAMLILDTRARLRTSQAEITKLIEHSASQSEAYLRATLNSIDAGFIGIDIEGTVTICNEALAKLAGREDLTKLLGQPLAKALNFSSSESVAGAEGVEPILNATRLGNTLHGEGSIYRPDQSILPVEYWLTPTLMNGSLQGAVISVVDISEKKSRNSALAIEREKLNATLEKSKRTELGLARERYFLDQIFKNSPAAMATWTGEDLVFTRINPRYQAIFPGRELTGKRLLEACPELAGQGFDDLLRGVMRTGEPWFSPEVLVKLAPAPGLPTEDRYFNVSYLPVYDEQGKINAVYNHSVEITEAFEAKRQLEEAKKNAEAANVAKSQFLANMSHEIRTPLGAIIGFADILSDGYGTEEERRHLFERIAKNGSRLTSLIDDLLDLTKVEANRINVEKVPCDLFAVLSELDELFALKASEQNIALNFKVSSTVPRFILSDAKRLRQIFVNLIGNALKFTPSGGRVEVSVSASAQDMNCEFIFRVTDSGSGIPDTQITRLFQPFEQGDVSITRKYGGSGLGLFVSRRLARLLDGDVEIESSIPGKGSVFKFVLNAQLTNDRTLFTNLIFSTNRSANESRKLQLKGCRVLVADDSEDNRELLLNFLQSCGAIVSLANNGREAVDRALSAEFDVVLMDIQMPVLDGNSAMIELKSKGYTKPVIACTAHAMNEERDHSLTLGFYQYLTKPISRDLLIRTISSVAKMDN